MYIQCMKKIFGKCPKKLSWFQLLGGPELIWLVSHQVEDKIPQKNSRCYHTVLPSSNIWTFLKHDSNNNKKQDLYNALCTDVLMAVKYKNTRTYVTRRGIAIVAKDKQPLESARLSLLNALSLWFLLLH